MKKFYFIFPICLLAIFCFAYTQFSKSYEASEADKAAKVVAAKAADEAKKKEAEVKSRKDSEERMAAKAAEEKKKEDERVAKWNADNKKIADETTAYNAKVATYTSDISSIEKQLADLKATKDKRTRELLAASSEAELAMIAKHNADMEVQRMTEMLVKKAAGTSLVSH